MEATFAIPAFAAPLVGRKQELGELDRALERALQQRTPQVVTIVGGEGMGKSHLVGQWVAAVTKQHAALRAFRGTPGSTSYGLFTSLLHQRFNLTPGTEQLDEFRRQVQEVLEDRRLAEVLHFLGSFVGISVPENPFLRVLEEAPTQHDQIARTVLRRFLELDAQRSPLLIVLEDLDAADDDSLSLYLELAETMASAPIVLLGTCRPELFVRLPELATLSDTHRRLELGPLDQYESEELLRHLLSRVPELPETLIGLVIEMSGGNPFFVEELVRVLVANGTIQAEGEVWTLDEARAESLELPVSVEEAVHARIASLARAERDVLEKAAVLGSVFWVDALICFRRLEREVDSAVDLWLTDRESQTLEEILDGLVERDFIMPLPDSSVPETREYAFKHNLERELIERMTDRSRTAQFHLFAAQWLETRLRDRSESQLEYVGHHYELGGNKRRAAFFYVHAGDKARGRYAGEQAMMYYRRGLELLGIDDVLAKIEALHNLGDVCAMVGRYEEALGYFAQMLHSAWLLDHRAKGGAAHRRIGRIYRSLGDYERALTHLNGAIRLFEQSRDTRGVAATLDDVGQVAQLQGRYGESLDYHRRALAVKREIGNARAIAVTLNNIGTTHLSSGSFKEAVECFSEALNIRRQVGDRVGIVDSLLNLGRTHSAQNDHAAAFELWSEALELAREIGDRLNEGYLLISLGESLVELGKLPEAEQRLGEASALAQELGDKRLQADCSRAFALIKLASGDIDGAEREAERAYDLSGRLGLRAETGSALRTLAEVVAAQAPDETRKARAIELFNEAIQLFTDLGHDLELARTFASLADCYDRWGQWEDADHFRASADEIFGRMKRVGSG